MPKTIEIPWKLCFDQNTQNLKNDKNTTKTFLKNKITKNSLDIWGNETLS